MEPKEELDEEKRKCRNSWEKKRRDQFNNLLNELAAMVTDSSKKMDKASVLRESITFLKTAKENAVKEEGDGVCEEWKPSYLSNSEFSEIMLEAMDSFLITLAEDGEVVFVSDSIGPLLGFCPSEVTGCSLMTFLSPSERQRVALQIKLAAGHGQLRLDCHFLYNCESSDSAPVYEPITICGQLKLDCPVETTTNQNTPVGGSAQTPDGMSDGGELQTRNCFCCTVRLARAPLLQQRVSPSFAKEREENQFVSQHSNEWKFLYVDQRAPNFIGYLPFEVLGTSFYDYVYPDDLEHLTKSHRQLIDSGEGRTNFYRFLTKGQQWLWIQTHYYTTYHQWSSKPEFIVCTHTVATFNEVVEVLRTSDVHQSVTQHSSNDIHENTASTSNAGLGMDMGLPQMKSERILHNASGSTIPVSPNTASAQQSRNVSLRQLLSIDATKQPIMTSSGSAGSVDSSPVTPIPQRPSPVESATATSNMRLSGSESESKGLNSAQLRLQQQLQSKHMHLQAAILRQQEQLQQLQKQLLSAQKFAALVPHLSETDSQNLVEAEESGLQLDDTPALEEMLSRNQFDLSLNDGSEANPNLKMDIPGPSSQP